MLSAVGSPSVMTRPAVESFHFHIGPDLYLRLHGEANVHVIDPAGELRPMEPVIKSHRRDPRLRREIAHDYRPVIGGRRQASRRRGACKHQDQSPANARGTLFIDVASSPFPGYPCPD